MDTNFAPWGVCSLCHTHTHTHFWATEQKGRPIAPSAVAPRASLIISLPRSFARSLVRSFVPCLSSRLSSFLCQPARYVCMYCTLSPVDRSSRKFWSQFKTPKRRRRSDSAAAYSTRFSQISIPTIIIYFCFCLSKRSTAGKGHERSAPPRNVHPCPLALCFCGVRRWKETKHQR